MLPLHEIRRRVGRSEVVLASWTAFTFILIYATQRTWAAVLPALAEAMFIATVIATIVDPYIKRRFAAEVGDGMFWAILNPDAPEDQRRAVARLASSRVIYEVVSWTVDVSWANEDESVVKLEFEVATSGKSFQREGYRPSGRAYVLPSIEGFQTEYLEYRFSGSGVGPKSGIEVNLTQAEGRSIQKYVMRKSDGRVELDQSKILEEIVPMNAAVAYAGHFHCTRRVRIFRHPHGFFPLVNLNMVRESEILVTGPAAKALSFSLLDAVAGTFTDLPSSARLPLESLDGKRLLILSWSPLTPAAPAQR